MPDRVAIGHGSQPLCRRAVSRRTGVPFAGDRARRAGFRGDGLRAEPFVAASDNPSKPLNEVVGHRPPTSRRERRTVAMLLGHLKRILKLDRLGLRGPDEARDAFHLAAAQNLRKLTKLIPLGQPSLA